MEIFFQVTTLVAALGVLLNIWLTKRLESAVEWEVKARAQAERIAGYLAEVISFRRDGRTPDYPKLIQMDFELALWLPEKLYKRLSKAVHKYDSKELLESVLEARKILLDHKAGSMTEQDILIHRPPSSSPPRQ